MGKAGSWKKCPKWRYHRVLHQGSADYSHHCPGSSVVLLYLPGHWPKVPWPSSFLIPEVIRRLAIGCSAMLLSLVAHRDSVGEWEKSVVQLVTCITYLRHSHQPFTNSPIHRIHKHSAVYRGTSAYYLELLFQGKYSPFMFHIRVSYYQSG